MACTFLVRIVCRSFHGEISHRPYIVRYNIIPARYVLGEDKLQTDTDRHIASNPTAHCTFFISLVLLKTTGRTCKTQVKHYSFVIHAIIRWLNELIKVIEGHELAGRFKCLEWLAVNSQASSVSFIVRKHFEMIATAGSLHAVGQSRNIHFDIQALHRRIRPTTDLPGPVTGPPWQFSHLICLLHVYRLSCIITW